MEEREKVEVFERVVIAWNSGDLDGVVAELTPDFEWDCTHSGIPGLSEVYRGHEEYLQFAKSWRETLGPTQLMLEEARELDDGRLYVGVHQTATGPQSGVDVEIHFAQILEFDGDKTSRAELFGSRDEGKLAAGLKP
jgi:ketosteroid isomerase-like protein